MRTRARPAPLSGDHSFEGFRDADLAPRGQRASAGQRAEPSSIALRKSSAWGGERAAANWWGSCWPPSNLRFGMTCFCKLNAEVASWTRRPGPRTRGVHVFIFFISHFFAPKKPKKRFSLHEGSAAPTTTDGRRALLLLRSRAAAALSHGAVLGLVGQAANPRGQASRRQFGHDIVVTTY